MSRQSPGVTGEEPLQHAALRRGTVGRQRDQKHRQGMQPPGDLWSHTFQCPTFSMTFQLYTVYI